MRRRKVIKSSVAATLGTVPLVSRSEASKDGSITAQQECEDCFIEIPAALGEDPNFEELSGSGTVDSIGYEDTGVTKLSGGGSRQANIDYDKEELNVFLNGSAIRTGTLGVGTVWNTIEAQQSGECEFTFTSNVFSSIEKSWVPFGTQKNKNEGEQPKQEIEYGHDVSKNSADTLVDPVTLSLVSIGLAIVGITISVTNTKGSYGAGYAIIEEPRVYGEPSTVIESGSIPRGTDDSEGTIDTQVSETATAELEDGKVYRIVQSAGAALSATGFASVDVDHTVSLNEVEYEFK